MLGAICGDIIGSYYEVHCTKDYSFPLFNKFSTFTDDTIMNIAVCKTILDDSNITKGYFDSMARAKKYAYQYKGYYHKYRSAGYGYMFSRWANSDSLYTQRSFSNGGAMRVIPIAYAYQNLEDVLNQTSLSCKYTHNHREAIKGAKAVSHCVWLSLNRYSKSDIKSTIEKVYHYDLSYSLSDIKEYYSFDSSTSYTVSPSIVCFLQSTDYEDAIRLAISLGGDADTMACITGGIAEAYYKNIPKHIKDRCLSILDIGLKSVIFEYYSRFVDFKI